MTTVTNSYEGGTNGTTLTQGAGGNTGGASGSFFDVITTGTGTTNAFDSTRSAHGLLSVKIATGSTSASSVNAWTTSVGTNATVWVRAYLYFTAAPSVQHRVLNFVGSAASRGTCLATTGGKFIFTDAAGTTQLTSAAFPTGAWFRLEAMFTGSATVGQWQYWIYYQQDSYGPPNDTQATAATLNTGGSCDTYRFGISSNTVNAGPFWMDDIGVSTTAALGPAMSPPAGGSLVSRRRPARAVTGPVILAAANAAPTASPSGRVQPRATVPVPRRYPARGWFAAAAGPALPPPVPGAGVVQPQATFPLPRRYPARAGLWRQVTGPANATGPAGRTQPRASVPVPRRTASRVSWAQAAGPANAHGGNGTVQPRSSVPVPRRYPARAVWRGNVSGAFLNGSVQPWPTVAVPRRKAARAVTASVLGPANAHGPSGTEQPRATVPVPRRTAARAVWASLLGALNAHGGNGTVQPKPVIGRRAAARAVTHWTPVAAVNAAPNPPVTGTVQPAATAPVRRRNPQQQRGAWRAVPAPFPPPSGTVQPPVTAPHRAHAAQRVIWRGQAVPGTQPQPATGGLVRRRTAARGLWRSVTGSPPPSVPSGTPVTGGRVVTRRPPSRGQWHGNTGPGNAHGVAVAPPRMRPRITSRMTARAVWNGTVVATTNNHGAPGLFSLGPARLNWAAARGRLQWSTGRARGG